MKWIDVEHELPPYGKRVLVIRLANVLDRVPHIVAEASFYPSSGWSTVLGDHIEALFWTECPQHPLLDSNQYQNKISELKKSKILDDYKKTG